ncbi:MAG: c-type cytochrome [Verrucomicrobiales bacterium]|nr:c-type cytochrome [Verrucomicrobiales bacterium]MCP5560983.1 c-type cytochrome [Verrucomicrobiaceae bacterium]
MRLAKHLPTLAIVLSATCALADSIPADLESTRFAGPDVTPSPACLCVSAQGEVYVGVDLNGSLGKGPGKGRIVKLVDKDRDGVADTHTVFAAIDNARGLIAIGSKLYALHTAFGKDGAATGMDLVVLEDANADGVADGPAKVLVHGICSATSLNARGTDHSTNGIRMGIDGWIYIAVGDFGFADATGTDGKKLTLLGGGIARVRPDGTELEMYTTGTRNIYDVAIDPFMNCFTRGNTNDGGNWNVRFLHHLQSGEYGYPRLFLHFASEIIPALEDVGGGSGVGSLFLSEPTWPAQYNNQPLMADWGRNAIYLHRLTADGASFTQKVEEFAQVSQVTDLDVDPSGQMFVSAWDGAGFKGDASKGYVLRITPKGWKPAAVTQFAKAATSELVGLLSSASATTRFYAQQEILTRAAEVESVKPLLSAQIGNQALSLESRVAALFTLAQLEINPQTLLTFASDEALREFALRAATDRLPRLKDVKLPLEPFVQALQTGTERQKAVAATALGRIGDVNAAAALLSVPFTKPADEAAPTVTEKFTIKGGRKAEVKLAVKPGNELRLHISSTNDASAPATVGVSGSFALADGSSVDLTKLQPKSGQVITDQPASAPAKPGKNKKAKKAKVGGPMLLASGPEALIYAVPENAVAFIGHAEPTKGKDSGESAEFFASTGSAGEAIQASTAPRHATPNSAILVPHLAAHALMRLRAIDACLAAVGTTSEDLALWALSSLHEESVVDGLLAKLKDSATPEQREKILVTLGRVYQEEAPYDGSWWWTTRPDTRGPYYKPVTWSASARIATALEAELANAAPERLDFLAHLNDSHRLGLEKLGTREVAATAEKLPTVDLAKIASQQGAVASTPIEDVILSIAKLKPNHQRGEQLFTQQGCVACHALKAGGPALGPFMGQVGSIMNPEQIATAILRPSDTISQGFQTISLTMKDGTPRMGFATETTADKIVLRDLTGAVTAISKADIAKEDHLPISMMPQGLANSLSLDDFAALVHFLASHK